MNEYDITTRTADEGRLPLVPLVHPHEISQGGVVFRDENVTITPALAYRFDTADRSIVISGDTEYSDALVRLARGADILVHEVMYPSAVDRLVAPLPNAVALKRSILSHHSPPEDAGRVAAAAGVKKLVLSHFVPAEDPAITEQMWIDGARTTFKGEIIAGRDLLEI